MGDLGKLSFKTSTSGAVPDLKGRAPLGRELQASLKLCQIWRRGSDCRQFVLDQKVLGSLAGGLELGRSAHSLDRLGHHVDFPDADHHRSEVEGSPVILAA